MKKLMTIKSMMKVAALTFAFVASIAQAENGLRVLNCAGATPGEQSKTAVYAFNEIRVWADGYTQLYTVDSASNETGIYMVTGHSKDGANGSLQIRLADDLTGYSTVQATGAHDLSFTAHCGARFE